MKATATKIRLQTNEDNQVELVLTLKETRLQIQKEAVELKSIIEQGKQLTLELTQLKRKRSLDANSYCWVLCQKIAETISKDKGVIYTKEDIYKRAIREVGQFETLAVTEAAAEQFIKVWDSRGLGWYAEEMDSKIAGCKKIIAYYGSSCYDTKAMSRLIEYIVQDAKQLKIETMTPNEIASMVDKWDKKAS